MESPLNPPWPSPNEDTHRVLRELAESGDWGRYHGPHCERLSSLLKSMHNVDHVHLCSSGTAAIELALRSIPVQSGDEVILAAYDFKANFVNVLTIGATPVLVDTLPGLPVIDVQQIEQAITPGTKAVIVSHLHGCLAPMDSIRQLLDGTGICLIEDACQVPGAVVNGKPAGAWGDAGTLSFGGSKLLTAGRGGAILFKDPQMAQRARLYTQRGNDAYPLSEMQAAILRPQLDSLADLNSHRANSVSRLLNQLETDPQIQPAMNHDPRKADAMNQPAFYKVAFRFCSVEPTERSREKFLTSAKAEGLAVDAGFSALHLTHSRRRFNSVGTLEHATALHHELIKLHHPVLLQSPKTIDAVAAILTGAAKTTRG
ncbi:MAG: aminotransferase class V-fold PLP-dependent enzyme [Planctomycetaceae bacterium]|nr:aminotransferase class V-fold PLP-dependent enzyme [Planctomycetaceae bacterium]